MKYDKLREDLLKLNRYDEEIVILGIIEWLKKHPENDLLRLRLNGIDTIKSNSLSLDVVKEQLKHWNCEWIELKNYEG